MGSVRRTSSNQYLAFLGLNVIVSAVTVTIVLLIWGRGGRGNLPAPTPTATMDIAAQIASAVPTATATLPPSPTPATYTVQPGDTLFGISRDLGIDLEALMAANGLTDPNTLSAGQVLRIPEIEGSSGAQTGAQSQATAQATVTPNPDAQAPRVEIREVSGAGVLEGETVLLLNRGGQADMADWTLDDGRGNRYTFPSFVLHNNGAVSVHTGPGRDTAIDLYWGMDRSLWSVGTLITLRDASGAVQSTFEIP